MNRYRGPVKECVDAPLKTMYLPVSQEYFQSPPQSDCLSKHTISGISLPCSFSLLKWNNTDIPLGPAPITQTRFALDIFMFIGSNCRKKIYIISGIFKNDQN